MSMNSRQLARTWPYPRHRRFVKEVRSSAASWFQSKGYAVRKKYAYILAEWSDWPKNIIIPEVASFIECAAEQQRTQGLNFPLHKYIHHGLSSQAMLFNLIGPLLVSSDLSSLQSILEHKGVKWPIGGARAVLEYEDRSVFNEDSGQPTSIDLAIIGPDERPRIFIESKFVETEFGGCSLFSAGDCDGRNPSKDLDLCYLHHIGRKYWLLLKKYGFDHGPIKEDSICALANHYQFFRELLFALEHDGIFILLCDERSPVFYSDGPKGLRGLMPYLVNMTPEQLRKRVFHVTIQELLRELNLSGGYPWVNTFAEKYGLGNITQRTL